MLKYHCTNCWYVYNPYIWDPEQEAEPGTDFESLNEDWLCPVCAEWKDFFVELAQSVHEISDIEDLLPQEETHVPFYTEEDGKLLVEMWTEDNPFVQDDVHFVEYIGVFDENWDPFEIIDMPNLENWPLVFELPDYEFWELRASCSLHWVWKGMPKYIE
ncbi:MAG: acyl-CoA dehydrogenase protein [uncultured bacterium (gcode 4)]|uniref:Rubredoxin n=1 Tax=uncultured bacterium (gcode 4) TaxID=1234023 RepID=K2GFN5_9BACT|nr:MAG: acyl-CoA dehydrogenase protein [uncultured bacterium (gcode 4)]